MSSSPPWPAADHLERGTASPGRDPRRRARRGRPHARYGVRAPGRAHPPGRPLDRQTLCSLRRCHPRWSGSSDAISSGRHGSRSAWWPGPSPASRRVLYGRTHSGRPRCCSSSSAPSAVGRLIFTRTKHRADRVARAVTAAGHRAARLHADRSMSEAARGAQRIRSGRYRVLIATDIGRAGIDVPEIAHVVNFDLPGTPEGLHPSHRGGRHGPRRAASRRASPPPRSRTAARIEAPSRPRRSSPADPGARRGREACCRNEKPRRRLRRVVTSHCASRRPAGESGTVGAGVPGAPGAPPRASDGPA